MDQLSDAARSIRSWRICCRVTPRPLSAAVPIRRPVMRSALPPRVASALSRGWWRRPARRPIRTCTRWSHRQAPYDAEAARDEMRSIGSAALSGTLHRFVLGEFSPRRDPNDWWGEPSDAMIGSTLVRALTETPAGDTGVSGKRRDSAEPNATVQVNVQRSDETPAVWSGWWRIRCRAPRTVITRARRARSTCRYTAPTSRSRCSHERGSRRPRRPDRRRARGRLSTCRRNGSLHLTTCGA